MVFGLFFFTACCKTQCTLKQKSCFIYGKKQTNKKHVAVVA